MKAVAQTISGLEDVSIAEVGSLIGINAKKLMAGRIIFEATEQQAKELSEKSRSLLAVYDLKQEIKFSGLEDLTSKIKKFEFEAPFVVRCNREGEHGFHSTDAEREIGEKFYDNYHKVDLHNPKTTIIADITGNKCLIGIWTVPKELSKRNYRLRAHPRSINPCLAYGLIKLSGWAEDQSLLNPYCKDGTIAVEAALSAKNPKGITATDTRVNLNASEINAKLAGVNKKISFAENAEGMFDCIITNIARIENPFSVAKKLLQKNGKLAIITQNKNLNHEGFSLIHKREARLHKATYTILVCQK